MSNANTDNRAARWERRKACLAAIAKAQGTRAGTAQRHMALAEAYMACVPLAEAGAGDFIINGEGNLPLEIDRITKRTVYVRRHYWTRGVGKPYSLPGLFQALVDARREERMILPNVEDIDFQKINVRDEDDRIVAERIPLSIRTTRCLTCDGEGGEGFDDPETGPGWASCPDCDGEGVEVEAGRWLPHPGGGYDCYHSDKDCADELRATFGLV